MTWIRADECVHHSHGPPSPGSKSPVRQMWDGDDVEFSEASIMASRTTDDIREGGGSLEKRQSAAKQTADVARNLRKKLRHRMRMQAYECESWSDDWASSKVHMFAEVFGPNDELFKRMAKEFGLDTNMVESIFNIFQRYDEDASGEIEYEEFTQMMCEMLGATGGEVPEKRLTQFWQEIDIDHSRCIEFEEFLLFYVQNFLDPTDPHGSPMKNFYRRAAQRGHSDLNDHEDGHGHHGHHGHPDGPNSQNDKKDSHPSHPRKSHTTRA
jgi:hypothetical protein